MAKADIVSSLEHQYPAQALLKFLDLSASSYYYHRNKPATVDRYEDLRPVIRGIYDSSYRSYGYRRVKAVLANKHGIHISGKTLLRLLREEGRTCQVRKRKPYRSFLGDHAPTAPNLLNRDFTASRPNQKWATDVTEFYVAGQKQYLSPVIDLFNREVIAYELASTPAMPLVKSMIDKAITKRVPGTQLVIHSDQGWQYRHRAYQNTVSEAGMTQSMSRKGNCLDNAVAENFFGHFKEEFLRQHEFATVGQFKKELEHYVHWFNHERIQLKLKGLSPVQYRTQSLANLETTPN